MTISAVATVTTSSDSRSTEAGSALTFLATGETTTVERRIALAVAIVSVVVFIAAVPFARVKLIEIPAFIPAYVTSLVVVSLVTAVILLGQFLRLHSLALLALCSAYFFDAFIAVFYELSFPGTFGPQGIIGGGQQTTAWLYAFWHAGMPLFVIAYAIFDRRSGHTVTNMRLAVVASTALVLASVAVFVVAATIFQDYLPPIMSGGKKITSGYYVLGAAWLFGFAALYVMWRKGMRNSLDVWVTLAMLAWVCDVGLAAAFNGQRYDLGYYAGRFYGFAAISFVLVAMLIETTGLHSRVAKRAERLSDEVKRSTARMASTEAQLRQAQKMEAIGALTGGIAHDFNNLLAVIIGNLDLLVASRGEDSEVQEFAGEALSAAERGADLTRRLLAFARRQPLQPRHVDLNDLIAAITRLLGRTLGETIEISLDPDPDLWPVVVDPAQFDAALANLATNARDAMPNGGSLIIVTGNRFLDADYATAHPDVTAGEYAMVEVSDTGSGMSAEIMSRVFEPFFTTKDAGKGTGLGLSMVYGFVRQSGGHINLYSEAGIGTTFRLYLPRDPTGQPVAEVPVATASVVGGGETVLAVEDNPSLRRIATRQLRELGYRVFEAESGSAGLEILRREPVDLLFTDVVMAGGMSGLDLAEQATAEWPELRVLITSGFPDARLSGNGGIADTAPWRLLNKPYRKQDLARFIREVLDGPGER